MKTQVALTLVICLMISSCCTKKACPSWELPSVTVHFLNTGHTPGFDKVTVYTLIDNAVRDSSEHDPSSGVTLIPFSDYDARTASGKQFVIAREDRRDTLSGFTADFSRETVECNDCFPLGKQRETIWKFSDFRYKHNSTPKTEFSIEIAF